MNKEKYEKDLINKVLKCIERYNGYDILSSIIITGSFGRGEPTYNNFDNGVFKLKSDVEIALIYSKFFYKSKIEKLIENVTEEFEEELNLMAIDEKRVKKAYNFNFSFKVPKYKSLFTYDLFNGSYTLWGQDFLKENKVSLKEVDLYEAKRLVANRIGELIFLQNDSNKQNKDYILKQWKGKLMLAIASAWLLCEEKYVSSYKEQFKVINENKSKVEEFFGQDFLNDYNKVFDFLRCSGNHYEINDDILRVYVYKIQNYFKKNNLNHSNINNFVRKIKYVFKYLKTDKKFGMLNFEDAILQNLILGYVKGKDNLSDTAIIWHKVLY